MNGVCGKALSLSLLGLLLAGCGTQPDPEPPKSEVSESAVKAGPQQSSDADKPDEAKPTVTPQPVAATPAEKQSLVEAAEPEELPAVAEEPQDPVAATPIEEVPAPQTAAAEPDAAEPLTEEQLKQQAASKQALIAEESVGRFHELLRRRPMHGPAFAGLVKQYSEQGQLDKLVSEYEKKVEALPEDQAFRILLARVYLRANKPEQAAEAIKNIGELPPDLRREELKLLVFKSEVYQRIGSQEQAVAMLQEAFAQAKTVSERMKLSEALADLHLRGQDRAAAAAALTKLAEQFSDNYFHRKRIADALAARDLFEQAIEQYREILPLVENETDKRCEVLRQLGRSFERLDRGQDAIEVYQQAINLLRSGHWLQRELHERVVSLYRASGRLDELVTYCREQIKRTPEQTAVRGLLADVLAAAGKLDEAKQTLTEAVELFPKNRDLSAKRIEFLQRHRDDQGVSDEYARIIAQYPDEIEFYVAYGQFLAGADQIDAARNQWRHVLEKHVTEATLANRLGGLFDQYNLQDDAVECYELAITLEAGRPESYTSLARLWFFRGDKDKAAETLDRLRQANPDDAAIHAELSNALLGIGLVEEATAAITRASELAPEQVRYQLARSDLLIQVGRLEESLKVRRAAVDLIVNPQQQIQAIDVLVSMYASAGKLDELKTAESKRLSEKENDPVGLLLLARVADFDRDMPAARRHLTALLAADPSHEEAGRQLAKIHEAVGDVDGAVAQYRKLIDAHPARGRYYYQAIADVKLRYNDRLGAIETFDEMVKAAPGNATVLKSVAEQLTRLDELERAIAYYEQSLGIQADRHDVRLAFANALYKAGRLEDSYAEYKKVALQLQDRETALEALGKLHGVADQLGELEELLTELEEQSERNPENTAVVHTLAELLIREFEYTRAMKLLDLVLSHFPRDINLRLVRAELLRRLTRFDDALEEYRTVLRFPQIDRDFVLGQMGKVSFEAGRIDEARQTWKRINGKLYAGTLLRNNGLLNDAIALFQEGIRLKPDAYALHRNLVQTLQLAGKTDESLKAAQRLLDLEPDNQLNIRRLAKAYLNRGDRETAAKIAGRFFSAGVAEKKSSSAGSSSLSSYGAMPVWAYSMYSAWGGYGGGMGRTNLDRGIEFFRENGLMAELEAILAQQLEDQPENALLRQTAFSLFTDEFGKPEVALKLLGELETLEFPLEHRTWFGQSSQQDHFRVMQYLLIATKPALRDQRLQELNKKSESELNRDELLESAIIQLALSNKDKALKLLKRAVAADENDLVALSIFVDSLTRAEKFQEAEPHAIRLVTLLGGRADEMLAQMVERVRRDFVRHLPLQFQLRMTEELLTDIARKSTEGGDFLGDFTGFAQTMGYKRARLTLATIYAETDRIADAREIWDDLTPANEADAEQWTTLASIAQLHDQNDLAFQYYEKALQAAKTLAADPLLSRIYRGSMSNMWFGWGEDDAIDSTFNKIVAAFASQDKLIELYDFLRETEQTTKAKRVAEQYKLHDQLKKLYAQRLAAARATFLDGNEDSLRRSVPYFLHVCKTAEMHDQSGDWAGALEIYRQYLEDFPDELGLLTTLGEVAEAQDDLAQALEWEQKVVEAKQRLARRARDWSLREVFMTPSQPQVLASQQIDQWGWTSRWGKGNSWYGYGSSGDQLNLATSWMRIAQLYLSLDNTVAAADAMQRAIAVARSGRAGVGNEILTIIRQRGLSTEMLPVLRVLAIHLPTNEEIQLAFADSLQSNEKPEIAQEVYARMLRRGVSEISVLTQVKRRLARLNSADGQQVQQTLESVQQESAADPDNANKLMRLAKVYFYSLEIDKALETLHKVEKIAPHMQGLHDLLVEIYTLKGEREKLLAALRTKAARATNDEQRIAAQRRIYIELLRAGQIDESLEALKKLGRSSDPSSYQQIGMMLLYYGRHDEAAKQFEQAAKSNQYGMGQADTTTVKALALKGDAKGASVKLLKALYQAARQSTQYGGVYSGFGYDDSSNQFREFAVLFALYPEIADDVRRRLEQQLEKKPKDAAAAKMLMDFYRLMAREDLAESLMEKLTVAGASDSQMAARRIDKAIKSKNYDEAIKLGEEFIANQPKPKLPPGMPPQMMGLMGFASERNMMICKIADLYWKIGKQDKAFELYRMIIDEKVEQSQLAFAAICMMRGRVEEARELVDQLLKDQQVKSPSLLQFRAMLAALDREYDAAFDDLAQSAESGGAKGSDSYYGMMGGGNSNTGIALLASFAVRSGQLDRFAAFMQKQIAKNPNDWTNYALLAETLRAEGRIQESLAVLDQAQKVKTLKQQVLQQRIQWREGNDTPDVLIPLYESMLQLAERKVSSNSSRYSSGMMYGGGWGHQGDDQADTQELRNRLGELYWEQGDREKALSVWTGRMDLNRAASHIQLGQRYEAKEAYDLAEQSFQTALELDPSSQQARRALATLLFHRGGGSAALDHLRELFLRQFETSDDDDYSRYGRNRYGNDAEFRRWAVDTSHGSSQQDSPKENAADRHDEDRLVLAVLTGDWTTAKAELAKLRENSPYDPMVWMLSARTSERDSQWAEAIAARLKFYRFAQTSIGNRRDQLKLLLAGNQIKDAAAGIRQPAGQSTVSSSGPMSHHYMSMGHSWRYGNGDTDSNSSQLAALYLKLGEFDKAELFFLSGMQDISLESWNSLSALMHRRGSAERAVELEKLALVFSDDLDRVSEYAVRLAHQGQSREAIDLLIRAHRYAKPEDYSRSSPWSMMMGGWYGGSMFDTDSQKEIDFEPDEICSALHQVLVKEGNYDEVIGELNAKLDADPQDVRLAQLVLILQVQRRNWEGVRDTLQKLAVAHPHEPTIKDQLFHAHLQLEDWEAAMAIAEEGRAKSDPSAQRWIIRKAFVHLMKGEKAEAVAEIAPALDRPQTKHSGIDMRHVSVILTISRQHERLIEYLQQRLAKGLDETNCRFLLSKLYLVENRYADAAHLALTQVWNQPGDLTNSNWYRILRTALRSAKAEQRPVEYQPSDQSDPADGALWKLLSEGPSAGREAFAKLVADNPDLINARRGLIAAAQLEGNYELALEQNGELLKRLAKQRDEIWRPAKPRPIGELIDDFLQMTQTTEMVSGAALSMGMQFAQMFTQMISETDSSQAANPVPYANLVTAHERLHRRLLLLNDRPEEFIGLTRKHAENNELREQASRRSNRMFRSMNLYTGFGPNTWMWDEYDSYDDSSSDDWGKAAIDTFQQRRKLKPLLELMEQLGSRVNVNDMLTLAETYAALGRQEDARRAFQIWADNEFAQLLVSDSPDIADDDRYGYGWGWRHSAAEERIEALRRQLRDVRFKSRKREESGAPRNPISGRSNKLWEFALFDEGIRKRLLELEETIGPDWGKSRSFDQLLRFYQAQDDQQKVIELFERVFPADKILESEHLSDYLSACYSVKKTERIVQLLDAAEKRSSKLKNSVALVRLMLMRHEGRGDDADRLEQQLLAQCRPAKTHPYGVDERFSGYESTYDYYDSDDDVYSWTEEYTHYPGGRSYRSYRRNRRWSGGEESRTIGSLASHLNVPYLLDHDSGRPTLDVIRETYARHGLYRDASRIIELELQQAIATKAGKKVRRRLMTEKADLLHRAGDKQPARRLLEEVEAALQAEVKEKPVDSWPLYELARLYSSRAFGRDYEKALGAAQKAAELTDGPSHTTETAVYLYELGRYDEAWKEFQAAQRHGGFGGREDVDTFYKAGIAAHRAGDQTEAAQLLSQALWWNPLHKSAKQAKELTSE